MRMILVLLIFSCFYSFKVIAIEMEGKIFDENMHRQVLSYNPSLDNSYYCWKIGNEEFLEFLEIYKNRPISENGGGMGTQGNFFLWYLLKQIKPALVIESGVWMGQSTWMIEQAVPESAVIAIDPVLTRLVYTSKKASYTTVDFAFLKIPNNLKGPVVGFFDDHIDDFDRVMQAYKKGIKHLIFDDNYPACNEQEISHITLSNYLEMEQFKEKGARLKKIIKRYYVMPQIIGKISSHGACEKVTTNLPAIWSNLNDIDTSMREQMRIFSEDSLWYRWITYVELK